MCAVHNKKEFLDNEQIKSFIKIENQPYLTRLEIFNTISSTNSYLLDQAKQSLVAGAACFADHQTHGRGRQGKEWFSPTGNIYCSLLWRFDLALADLSGLSLAVAVMIAEALKKYGIREGIELKWPNDILYANRKLAGILLESLPEKDQHIAVVIGVGINMSLPPDAKQGDWIDIASITKDNYSRNKLAGLLLNELLEGLPKYQKLQFEAFRDPWRCYDILLSKQVTIKTPWAMYQGVVRGIGKQGELLLEESGGSISSFHCGEVSVRLAVS